MGSYSLSHDLEMNCFSDSCFSFVCRPAYQDILTTDIHIEIIDMMERSWIRSEYTFISLFDGYAESARQKCF